MQVVTACENALQWEVVLQLLKADKPNGLLVAQWWPNGGPMVAQTFGLISFDGWSLDLFGTRSFGPELGLVSLCPMFLMAMK